MIPFVSRQLIAELEHNDAINLNISILCFSNDTFILLLHDLFAAALSDSFFLLTFTLAILFICSIIYLFFLHCGMSLIDSGSYYILIISRLHLVREQRLIR